MKQLVCGCSSEEPSNSCSTGWYLYKLYEERMGYDEREEAIAFNEYLNHSAEVSCYQFEAEVLFKGRWISTQVTESAKTRGSGFIVAEGRAHGCLLQERSSGKHAGEKAWVSVN